jgi:hypothetical protein
MKRSMTTPEESITAKRAKRYMNMDDLTETQASPFFTSGPVSGVHIKETLAGEDKETDNVADVIDSEGKGNSSFAKNDDLDEQMLEDVRKHDEPQQHVCEMPNGVSSLTEDEGIVAPDPPTDDGEGGSVVRASNLNEANHPPESRLRAQGSRGRFSLNRSSSTSTSSLFYPRPSHVKNPMTPILIPGNKKHFTPRPSYRVFPDTPSTPSLTTQQDIVQGWKGKFMFTPSSSAPSSVSRRPMTPVQTPLFRQAGVNQRIEMATEEIGEISPPRPMKRISLGEFRYASGKLD